MEFERVTPWVAVEAYHKTGMIPVIQVWTTGEYATLSESNLSCGCLLTTLVAAKRGVAAACRIISKMDMIVADAAALLGFPQEYAHQLIAGFDGSKGTKIRDTPGFIDGEAAWNAVLEDPILRQRIIDNTLAHHSPLTHLDIVNSETLYALRGYLRWKNMEVPDVVINRLNP